MKFPPDSCLPVFLAGLLLAMPAAAATAKKPAKLAAKPAAKAATVDPQPDPVTLVAQSRDAQSRGETELALRLAQSAIVADPARPASYDALADIYAANNAPDFARSYYSTALSIDPTDIAAQKAMSALDRGANDKRSANAMDYKPGTKTGNP